MATKYVRSYKQTLNENGITVSKIFPKGTLVMTIAANIGDVALLNFDAAFPDSLVGFFPRDGISVEWLFYVLQNSKRELLSLAPVNAQANLNLEKLEKFKVLVPITLDQQYIAEVLATWDIAQERLISQIAHKQALFGSLRETLVSGASRISQKNVPWHRLPLRDLGNFYRGTGLSKSALSAGGVPCLRYAEIYTSYGDLTDVLKSSVTSKAATTAFPVQFGDIIFAGSGETAEEIGKAVGYIGRVAGVVGGDTVIFRNHDQNPAYLARALNSRDAIKQKSRLGQGQSIVHIHPSELASIEIFLPPRDEQDRIATTLEYAEREISALEAKQAVLKRQYHALARNLLSGRLGLPGVRRTAVVAV